MDTNRVNANNRIPQNTSNQEIQQRLSDTYKSLKKVHSKTAETLFSSPISAIKKIKPLSQKI